MFTKYLNNYLYFYRPENKEGKEGDLEKSNEQENETDKNEKELEKEKVSKKRIFY